MGRDFQTFLKTLEAAGELSRVGPEVDPFLEMGAIADRVSKQPGGGKALLFEHPTGKSVPVAMNVFGSLKRMLAATQEELGAVEGMSAAAARAVWEALHASVSAEASGAAPVEPEVVDDEGADEADALLDELDGGSEPDPEAGEP